MNSPRRLRPGQDIYRIEKVRNSEEDYWAVVRYSFGVPKGFAVSDHSSRDEARAAKKEHERKLDERQKFGKVGAL